MLYSNPEIIGLTYLFEGLVDVLQALPCDTGLARVDEAQHGLYHGAAQVRREYGRRLMAFVIGQDFLEKRTMKDYARVLSSFGVVILKEYN